MEVKPKLYHHENLRDSLIQAGINIVNEQGYEQLSMRKIASACGVSHAAPYRHFKDKEDLMAAMQELVEEKFSKILRDAIEESQNAEHPMIEFGKAYVLFFFQHPEYYAFFTRHKVINIIISSDATPISNYLPFEIFRDAALRHLTKMNVPPQFHGIAMTGMWSTVHGLASMATMPGVQYDGDWGELTGLVLKGVQPHE